jgi:hypothetical protein
MKNKESVWCLRCGREVIQFATQSLALEFKKPDYWICQVTMFLAPRNPKHEFISTQSELDFWNTNHS